MEEASMEKTHQNWQKKKPWFWSWAFASILFRLILIYFPQNLYLSSLAEGYWLKQSSMSPYAGSMYHGSPILLSILGPLTVKRIDGQPNQLICRFCHCNAYSFNWPESSKSIFSKIEITRPCWTVGKFR
ncbi:hypothetical protein TEA_006909 [Camellia sinensis var. sinensis]|uniref:Uncharacterized protein n=1 Tax=Camellia sinensis var. sinensis TaxID=542762 RepID=A0A4V3WKI2_CAMSN|nr:hypothetical protein TEA_006909 [Camellia sinensis var. sinensis]